MTRFHFAIPAPNTQYLHIEAHLTDVAENCTIFLPKWRPGRYELGNFAKNVRLFQVFDSEGKRLTAEKIDHSSWKINNTTSSIKVTYQYYAAELNAGSTYVSSDQLYVNPVNCCIYTQETIHQQHEIQLDIPSNWSVAHSFNKVNATYLAADFHTLADSPFICSPHLHERTYTVNDTVFHIWFNTPFGNAIPWEKVLKDFEAFTAIQLQKFIEFPVKDYHFLIHLLPYRAYHGVEHQHSTVITLGPVYDVFHEFYSDLLGVSSHELYHTWNVKAIRPIEMYPYDYQQENYSKLGFLCEGVTTYMGDLMLFKSGVFQLNDYLKEMNTQLQKHFDNFARFTYSVADSSYDTWLDGYVPGAPNRKVSIYTEGCLLSFVFDVIIRQNTQNKSGLDEVMKRLYFQYALEGKGVSEVDYRSVLVQLGGERINEIIDDYVYGTRPFEGILSDAFEYLGLELEHHPSKKYTEGRLGVKTIPHNHHFQVKSMYPGGPVELSGIQLDDIIIGINGMEVSGDLDKWFQLFDDVEKHVMVARKGQILTFTLPEVQRHFYNEYKVVACKDPNSFQKKAFECWSK